MQPIKFKNRWYTWRQKIVTQITTDYVPDADLFWAIRESVQNMVDEGVVSGAKYAWFKEDAEQTAYFYDGGTGVAFNDILYLGVSGKRGIEGTVGRHGEGEVVSFMVAARLGVQKLMASQDWLASAEIINKDGYDLLAINLYRTEKPRKGTAWWYKGDYNTWYTFEQALHSFRPPSAKRGKRSSRGIVVEESGQLYTQGMKVNVVEGLALGYDLKTSPGRDRGGFTLAQVLDEVTETLSKANDLEIEKILRKSTWSWSLPKEIELDADIDPAVVKRAAKRIHKKLSWTLIERDGPWAADAVERGFKVIYIKDKYGPPAWISDNIPNVKKVVGGEGTKNKDRPLPSTLQDVMDILSELGNREWKTVCVYRFDDDTIIAQADHTRKVVVLARQKVKGRTFKQFVGDVAHEWSHLETGAADCTRSHGQGVERVMADLMDAAVENPKLYRKAKKIFGRYTE